MRSMSIGFSTSAETRVIILIVVLLGCAVSLFGGGSDSTSYTPVSAEVEAYTPLILWS